MTRPRPLAILLAALLLAGPTGAAPDPVSVPSDASAFTIERGESARSVADRLAEGGWTWHPWSFLFWVKLSGRPGDITPGHYALSPSWTGRRIFNEIRKGPRPIRVTFPEGWTSRQMADALGRLGITRPDDFLKEVDRQNLEGYLFPDTYYFAQDLPADRVAARLKSRFEEMKPSRFADQARALGLTERKLVILASLVEREAVHPEERPVIAGVFLNRLKKGWRLESCATVQYALGSWKSRLSLDDLKIDSPYNTYRRKGLPPGPICNPGAKALQAAAYPARTDMMFFVADGEGTHRFSKYFKDHLDAKQKKK